MTASPYVGIAGFTSPTEVDAVLAAVREAVPNRQRKLMVGVLASSGTLNGRPSPRFPKRYPRHGGIAQIFAAGGDVCNAIHYADPKPDGLSTRLAHLRNVGGERLHAVQLNIPWPDPDALRALEGIEIVLQLGAYAMTALEDLPEKIAQQVQRYGNRIHHVLIDASGGLARELKPGKALSIALAIRERCPGLGIGIAGALSAKTIHAIKPISAQVPDLSTDAEGLLRDERDDLNVEAASAYAVATFRLLEPSPLAS